MPDDSELVRLARYHQNRQINLADRAQRAVGLAWRTFGGLTDAAMKAFVDAVTPIVSTAITSSVMLTDAQLAQYCSYATGDTFAPLGVDPATIEYRGGGVDIATVYARPVIVARVAISEGKTFAAAMTAGGARAAQLADTDPMLAARAAATEIMQRVPRVQGYRRLADGNACEYCLVAATQRYHVGNLMPIHPSCHCTTIPIIGTADPGRIIDKEAHARLKASGAIDQKSYERRLADAQGVVENYQAAAAHWRDRARTTLDQEAETRYAKRADSWDAKAKARAAQVADDQAKLDKIRARRAGSPDVIAVHEHGELGPTLYPAGAHFDAAA